jgi:VIT1/CCC1 family predicted Fe2+/Mn2+ transporter
MTVGEGVFGKPSSGFGHYLRDMVYGALDGVVTTLAVISGTSGARLDSRVALILGTANLVADGLSMGASNYLGIRSELEQTGMPISAEKPWRHGLATTAAFALVGVVPLLAYVMPRPDATTPFHVAVVLAALSLTFVGVLRARYVVKPVCRSVAEVLATAGVASGAAYGIGAVVERFTR